jgi:hypothetical protein
MSGEGKSYLLPLSGKDQVSFMERFNESKKKKVTRE